MIGFERIGSDVPGSDSEYGDSSGLGYFSFEAVKVGIGGGRFPADIPQDRVIDLRENSIRGESEQGAGLDPRAERYGVEDGSVGNGGS